MFVLLDTANIDEIKRLYSLYPLDGITSNPTILKRAGESPMKRLKEIKEFLPEKSQIHVQVVSQNADEIVKEAYHITEVLGKETFVKIPVSDQGIKAIQRLAGEGYSITATAVYAPMQALMAAKAGAKYVAPYVNRLDNMGADGVNIVKTIDSIFSANGIKCRILAASFKNSMQITELSQLKGVDITAAPDVIEGLVKHPATDKAVFDFTNDFYDLTEKGKTMMDF